MEEYRKKTSHLKQSTILNLPLIPASQNHSKEIISSENALKLCRAGTRKEKFINFDLRTEEDAGLKHYRTPRTNVLIPLLRYKQNKFSPYKQKSPIKNHGLLISRITNAVSPSFGDYDTTNLCDLKYQKQKKFKMPNAERKTIFFFDKK